MLGELRPGPIYSSQGIGSQAISAGINFLVGFPSGVLPPSRTGSWAVFSRAQIFVYNPAATTAPITLLLYRQGFVDDQSGQKVYPAAAAGAISELLVYSDMRVVPDGFDYIVNLSISASAAGMSIEEQNGQTQVISNLTMICLPI